MSDAKRDAKRDLKIQTPMSVATMAHALMILSPIGAGWAASGRPMGIGNWKVQLPNWDGDQTNRDEFREFVRAITKLHGSLPPAEFCSQVETHIWKIRQKEIHT